MNNEFNKIMQKLLFISQLGITMLTTIFICVIAGLLIDKYFGTSLLIFFIILGVISGSWAVLKMLMKFVKQMEKEEEDKKNDKDREWVKKAFDNPDSETSEDKK